MEEVFAEFLGAVQAAAASQVVSLLQIHPNLDVNQGDDLNNNWTALHSACCEGHPAIVKLLLAHPAIHVNVQDHDGCTPFFNGCAYGQVSVVQLLLKDPRVNITLADDSDWSPLWVTSFNGHHQVIEWLIASGRDLGNFNHHHSKGKLFQRGRDYSPLEIATERNHTEVMSLLKRFVDNQALTRHEVRVKFGFVEERAAAIFALVIFICDELLQIKPAPSRSSSSSTTTKPSTTIAAATSQFFSIAKRLPMELQMVLCNRAVGSMKQNITSAESEAAFQSVAVTPLRTTTTSSKCLIS